MKIDKNHRLYDDENDRPYPFVESPNFYKDLDHDYLIMHYTANNIAASAIEVLSKEQKPVSKGVSAHLVIDQEGTITQLVPFNKGAWHAGESHWEGRRWLNHNSIGIELVNDGALKLKNGQWTASSGTVYTEDQIIIERHKHNFGVNGWPKYPEAQLKAAFEVSNLLITHYGLKDILGHEDVADARIGKIDPGPAFPMEAWRVLLFGRREPIITKYQLTQTVKAYADQGKTPTIKLPTLHSVKALPANTSLTVNTKTIIEGWRQVKIKGGKDGWVSADYLTFTNDKKAKTNAQTPVYAFQPDPMPPVHGAKTLPKGLQVRMLRDEEEWILVVALQDVPNYKLVQAWIPKGVLRPLARDAVV